MTIEIENNYPDNPVAGYRDIINHVVNMTLDYEKCPYESQVYVLLTDDEHIHEINMNQRGIDRATDVLSAIVSAG
jgi:probable rRNA maturation factor